jgi:glycosyltransferase involved in cell wall biosynthesis
MIVGDGDSRKELENLAVKLGIDGSVTFTGYIGDEEKAVAIQRMHLIVNTSSKEGWGLTVLEANACGIPVIASDVPGLRDAVVNGETGMLYRFGNVGELAAKIVGLLKDDQLRLSFSEGARKFAGEFSWDRSADRLLQKIEQVVREAQQ